MAIFISLMALGISFVHLFFTHLYKSKKLLMFVNSKNGDLFPVILINPGLSNVVIRNINLALRSIDARVGVTNSDENIHKAGSFIIKPGDAVEFNVKPAPDNHRKIGREHAEKSNSPEHIKGIYPYYLIIEWCDCSGDNYSASIDIFNIRTNQNGILETRLMNRNGISLYGVVSGNPPKFCEAQLA